MESEWVTAYLGLGSNLGDRRAAMRTAVAALDVRRSVQVDHEEGIAPVYETSPVGGPPGQRRFLNSVVRVRTTLAPLDLLSILQTVERDMGRERGEPWGPRVIDIDLLLYADLVQREASLTVPHPRMHQRRFVLEPLSEIAPAVVHPALGRTVAELCRACAGTAQGETVTRLEGPAWWAEPPGQASELYHFAAAAP